MTAQSWGRSDFESWAATEVAFHGLDVRRISTYLLCQLLKFRISRYISIYSVTDELQTLENLKVAKPTRPIESFKGAVLKGLHKKHFTDARFMMKNLASHFALDKGGNRGLTAILERVFAENESGYVDDKFCRSLAHYGTVEALEDRAVANRLTGEWIVIYQHEGANYYLTLAAHDEDDQQILSRAKQACEFERWPFHFGPQQK